MAHPQIVEQTPSTAVSQRIQATRTATFGAAATQGLTERREVDAAMAEQLRNFGMLK
jgi:hypothetical protein